MGAVRLVKVQSRLRTAALLVAAPVAVTVFVGVVGGVLFPGGDSAELVRRLVAVVLVAFAAVLVVGRNHAWRSTGAGGSSTWRHAGLLVVPALVALAPLVTGLNFPAAGTLAVLIAGYAATGVFEELWHRGVVLDALRSVGVRRSAVIGGGLHAGALCGFLVGHDTLMLLWGLWVLRGIAPRESGRPGSAPLSGPVPAAPVTG